MRAMRYRLPTLLFGLVLLVFMFAYFLYRAYTHSLYSTPFTRINISVWGNHSYVVSLGKTTKQQYIFLFPNSYEVQVPGGLQGYKIGALGKLSALENDPQLFAKAMGQGSGVFVHKYLHDAKNEIYDDDTWVDKISFSEIKHDIEASIFRTGNMSLLDRLYLYFAIYNAKPSQTTLVRVKQDIPALLLYDKVFWNEKKLVQIEYAESERTAYFISKLLENTGIRVADISKNSKTASECVVIESSETFSQTSQFLSSYFGCVLRRGNTGLYEIQWILNRRVEDTWKL